MSRRDAAVALARFGLGARPGEIEGIAGDPAGWVLGQFRAETDRPTALAAVQATPERLRRTVQAFHDVRVDADAARTMRQTARALLTDDIGHRVDHALVTDRPVHERLVQFWSNHFTVAATRGTTVSVAMPFEVEAIRPHVTGRFRALLGAVTRHPAMLLYLDNVLSVGPNSPFGQRRGRGLNENLARELLELHTLGVDGDYTQADVRALARILTGWSVTLAAEPRPGQFRFLPARHEPGDKTLLGVRIAEAGVAEGEAALDLLARHPATARHLATKLARHFVADDLPDTLVDRLAAVFRDTDGDLTALYRALVTAPEAWADPLAKIKTPNDLVLSAGRALGVSDTQAVTGSLHLMGQMPFAAPSPAGWPDRAVDWIGPEAMLTRADWATAAGRRVGRNARPAALLDQAVGPLAAARTRFLVQGAPSQAEGIALVLMSPAFQRR